jgi:hypothetical protein
MVFSLYSILGVGVSGYILALELVATSNLTALHCRILDHMFSILLDPKKVQILVKESFAAVMCLSWLKGW